VVLPDDADALRRIRAICRRFPSVEEAALQDRPLFRVGSRRFAIFNAEREALEQDPRFRPSPHHGDRGWLALRLDPGEVDWQEVAELLESAYRQAAGRRRVARWDGQAAK
jgi:predicted DNA-binding protein (MmcQ/YjbR family)